MNDLQTDAGSPIRSFVYALLLVTAVGGMTGRIWTVQSALGKTPLLSANDRSRWATIRTLVDHGTFALDDVIFRDRDRKKRDREWYSIDMVRHRGTDGKEHFYSSKPPLATVIMAGAYWCLQQLTGATLADRPFYVVRSLLLVANVLPLAVYFWLMFRLVERYGRTDWGRLFIAAGAAYGTFLTTFAVTLNNHVWAAVSAAAAMAATLAVWCDGRRRMRYFAAAGLFSAFAVVNELPALSFAAVVAAALAWRSPPRFLSGFLPAAALVAAAFFLTNYWAHGSWSPPYAHRGDGPRVATADGNHLADIQAGRIPPPLGQQLSQAGIGLSAQATVQPRWSGHGWMIWDPQSQTRLAVSADEQSAQAFVWDQWYEYELSYWLDARKTGVDRGEPSRWAYAFHVLIGHHGVFSLTPIWLLSLAGAGIWLVRGESRLRAVAAAVLSLSLVCLAFYLARPLGDRNYGGVACGFRWMFWFAPLWLLVMIPAADAVATRPRWRYAALAMLLISAMSAAYAALNPWSHPWLYEYWSSLGWI
ncbi:MAG: hypothetical protein GX575_15850 [Candidatus Anammoximicrobium sp.]|nr:hypothetical protein [Candidatus Anammoximicrobium sp.]